MRIEQLRSFLEVASSKSISIAAENLYITQPSLSRSLKLLEEELGLDLFIRSSDGVRLTTEGKKLLPIVQNILQQLDNLKQQFQNTMILIIFPIYPTMIFLLEPMLMIPLMNQFTAMILSWKQFLQIAFPL